MSTGNDTTLPAPIDAQPPAAPAAEPAPAPVDVDDIELQEALAAVKAEETSSAQPQQPETPAPAAPQPAAPQAQQPAGEQPAAPMIPKARFDEVNSRAAKAAEEAAYWRGVAEARAQAQTAPQGGQPAPAAPAPPTPEQRLADIATATEALAKRFDDGEITMTDFKREERKLADQEQAIREEILLKKVQPAAPAQNGGDQELYLETLTAQLETQHPWVGVFDQVGTQSDWAFLKNRAIENLVERGIDPSKGAVGKYELRKEMAQLADAYGPALVGDRARAKGIALPNAQASQAQQPSPQPQRPALSPQAQARAAALEKAAGAPPDITALNGHSGDSGGIPSEASLEAMSDEAITALPKAVRDKLMGIVH